MRKAGRAPGTQSQDRRRACLSGPPTITYRPGTARSVYAYARWYRQGQGSDVPGRPCRSAYTRIAHLLIGVPAGERPSRQREGRDEGTPGANNRRIARAERLLTPKVSGHQAITTRIYELGRRKRNASAGAPCEAR